MEANVYVAALFLIGEQFLKCVGTSANVSLARGKPTTQSSTFVTSRASLAVDGNYSAVFWYCAHTIHEPTLWTVDLQDVYEINKVNVYNRDGLKERLDNMYVEGFPMGDPYLCGNHSNLCGFNRGPSGDVVTLNCPKNTIARYIRLRGGTSMTICEVDVFGQAHQPLGCRKWNMELQPQTKLLKGFLPLGKALSPTGCMDLCQRHHKLCNVFSYNVINGSCLTPMQPIDDSFLTPDENWNLYYTC